MNMKLIFFHAPSCRTCKNQAEELDREAGGYDIQRVDVTSADAPTLMRRYHINDVPTIIGLNGKNQFVKKWVDFTRFDKIKAEMRNIEP